MNITVFDSKKLPIATTETVVKGVSFLYGEEHDLSLRGYSIAALPGEFVRAMRDGDTYLIEDAGEYWKLHLVAFRGERGLMVAPEPHILNKEGCVA